MRSEKRRLKTLTIAINPKGSLGARLAALTDDERDEYHRWRERCDRFYASIEASGANPYNLIVNEVECPPELHRDIGDALFGSTVTIPVDATPSQVAEIYNSFARGD